MFSRIWSVAYGWARGWLGALELDDRSLAVFRIGVALVILLDLRLRMEYWHLTVSSAGFAPVQDVIELLNPYRWSLYFLSGSDAFVLFLLTLTSVCALTLLLGIRPKLSMVALWVLMLSLHNRAPMLLNSGDTYLRLMLFWGMFLPLHRGVGIANAITGPGVRLKLHRLGELGLRVQIASVYFFSVFFKYSLVYLESGRSWSSGRAVHDALLNGMYTRPLGGALLTLPEFVWPLLTYSVLAIEFVAPVLLFVGRRWWWISTAAVASLALLHVTFILFMNVGWVFPLVGIVAVSALLPSGFWEWLHSLRRAPSVRVVYFEGGCGFCRYVVNLLLALTGRRSTDVRPASDNLDALERMERERSWVVLSVDGVFLTKDDGLRLVLREAWWCVPVAWLMAVPGVRWGCRRGYEWVAAHRPSLKLMHELGGRAPHLEHPRAWVVPAAVMFFVVSVNAASLDWIDEPVPAVTNVLHLSQKWSMFAPSPASDDGWFELQVMSDRGVFDVFGSVVPDSRPMVRPAGTDVARRDAAFGSVRWRKVAHEASRRAQIPLQVAIRMTHAACSVAVDGSLPERASLIHYIDSTRRRHLPDHELTPRVITDLDCLTR